MIALEYGSKSYRISYCDLPENTTYLSAKSFEDTVLSRRQNHSCGILTIMAGGHEDVEIASPVKSNVSLDVWVKENFPKSSAYSMTNDVKKRMETEPLRDNGRQYPERENGIWPESKGSNVDKEYTKDNGEDEEKEENEDDDDDDYSSGPLGDCVYRAQEMLKGFYRLHGRLVLRIIAALLLALYAAYFVAIIVHNPKKATAIIAITCVCVTGYAIYLINKRWGSNISAALNVPYSRIKRRLGKRKRKILTWYVACF